MITAVSITYQKSEGTGHVNFYTDEVESLQSESKQSLTLKRLQNLRPFILRFGQIYRCYTLNINVKRRSSLEKLGLLNGYRDVMEIEYPDGNGEPESVRVRLVAGIPTHYSAGMPAAKHNVELTFIEQE